MHTHKYINNIISVILWRNISFFNLLYVWISKWFHCYPLYLVSQWRTQERASQSQKTLCQTVLMIMTTPWQRSAAPSGPGRSCANSSMSITWSSEYFSSLWTTVSKKRILIRPWSVTHTPFIHRMCIGLSSIEYVLDPLIWDGWWMTNQCWW